MTIQNAIAQVLRQGIKFVLGSDATGDIYYRANDGTVARLGVGSNGQVLQVANGLPAWASQNVLSWSIITANQAAAINTGYIANGAALVVVTLPASAPVGSVIEVVGMGAGGWRLGQLANQSVIFSSVSSTTGTAGQCNSTHVRDCIRLVNVVADTTWQVISSIGNIDVI
jgi:hypothetical protein